MDNEVIWQIDYIKADMERRTKSSQSDVMARVSGIGVKIIVEVHIFTAVKHRHYSAKRITVHQHMR